MVEVIRLKEEIERKIDQTTSEEEIEKLRNFLDQNITEFDKIVEEKIGIFNDLIKSIGTIVNNNHEIIAKERDLALLKNKSAIMKTEIEQKKLLLIQKRQKIAGMKDQLIEVDNELKDKNAKAQ